MINSEGRVKSYPFLFSINNYTMNIFELTKILNEKYTEVVKELTPNAKILDTRAKQAGMGLEGE